MAERTIYITEFDKARLEDLLRGARGWNGRDAEHLLALERELERAYVVRSADIPPNVVTMNSQVRVKDLDSREIQVLTVVFPLEADSARGKISVLAPIGTGLLGYPVGETVEWPVPGGLRRLKIQAILYQPEAAGHYHR